MDNLATLTDLAVESRNIAIERTGGEISGVTLDETEIDHAKITRVEVLNEQAGQEIGKTPGNYVTIESEHFRSGDRQIHEYLSGVMADELNNIMNSLSLGQNNGGETILVIGLGNWNTTPDALGPKVSHHLLVTRHLYDDAPQDSKEGMRSVCSLSPGVLGLTGIETAEIIRGVVDRVQPQLIIAIDSLAAQESSRLASTIQISDTGIYPGSGLGKQRIGITEQDMGVPVIAMGMPTVINSVNIVNDTINHLANNQNVSGEVQQMIQQTDVSEQLIGEILQPFLGDLIVTPKGIDKLIGDMSRVIAGGINVALHPDIKAEDVSLYLQ
ncbi:GPR endopeptidase [Natroniella sulfidigena]|uniref:GPR endopeptidase n=1 Tax=Natroniella sulfidigena TaxID=723921 RepID=UPI00200B962D|nr:GPR endopeptidase [Natroniella sulfidigena]MCK8815912.1 GPR endopeptidase [Natroniella sulfidigena]